MKQKIASVLIIAIIFILAGYFLIQNSARSNYRHFFLGMATGIFSLTVIIWIIAFIVTVIRKQDEDDCKKKFIPKNQLFLSAGMICMFTGSLMAMHNKENAIIMFVSMVIIILSMIFNIIYIRRIKTGLSKG